MSPGTTPASTRPLAKAFDWVSSALNVKLRPSTTSAVLCPYRRAAAGRISPSVCTMDRFLLLGRSGLVGRALVRHLRTVPSPTRRIEIALVGCQTLRGTAVGRDGLGCVRSRPRRSPCRQHRLRLARGQGADHRRRGAARRLRRAHPPAQGGRARARHRAQRPYRRQRAMRQRPRRPTSDRGGHGRGLRNLNASAEACSRSRRCERASQRSDDDRGNRNVSRPRAGSHEQSLKTVTMPTWSASRPRAAAASPPSPNDRP